MKRIMVCLGLGFLWVAGPSARALEPVNVPQRLTATAATSAITWHHDIRSGWLESRRRNVPMVIFITSKKCTYCDAMKRHTWCDTSVQQRINRDFVAIQLSPSRNSNTLSRIDVKMYPTTLIGIPAGKIVGQREGYQPPSALHQLLTETTRGTATVR